MFFNPVALAFAILILSLPAWAEHSNTLSGSSSSSSSSSGGSKNNAAQSAGEKARAEMAAQNKDFSSAASKLMAESQKISGATPSGEQYSSPSLAGLTGKGATNSSGGPTGSAELANGYQLLSETAIAGMKIETEAILQRVDAASLAAAEAPVPLTGREKLEASRVGSEDPLGLVMVAIDEKNASSAAPALSGGSASAGSSNDHNSSSRLTMSSTRRGISSVEQGIQEKAYNVPRGFRP